MYILTRNTVDVEPLPKEKSNMMGTLRHHILTCNEATSAWHMYNFDIRRKILKYFSKIFRCLSLSNVGMWYRVRDMDDVIYQL